MSQTKEPRFEKITISVEAHCVSCKHSDIDGEYRLICNIDRTEVDRNYECPQWSVGLHIFNFSYARVKVE